MKNTINWEATTLNSIEIFERGFQNKRMTLSSLQFLHFLFEFYSFWLFYCIQLPILSHGNLQEYPTKSGDTYLWLLINYVPRNLASNFIKNLSPFWIWSWGAVLRNLALTKRVHSTKLLCVQILILPSILILSEIPFWIIWILTPWFYVFVRFIWLDPVFLQLLLDALQNFY